MNHSFTVSLKRANLVDGFDLVSMDVTVQQGAKRAIVFFDFPEDGSASVKTGNGDAGAAFDGVHNDLHLVQLVTNAVMSRYTSEMEQMHQVFDGATSFVVEI
jgi:hypothetical protein